MNIEIGQKYILNKGIVQVTVIGFSSSNEVVFEYEGQTKSIHIRNLPIIVFNKFYTLIKPTIVRYINMYKNNTNYSYSDRINADCGGGSNRIACIRVEFEEGQFDD